MRFANVLPTSKFLFVSVIVVIASATAPNDCKLRDYDMETFIGANANHCTPKEMKKMDETMDKVIYQIFPTVRGLEQADMTTCPPKAQHAPDDFRRKLSWGGDRRCRFCIALSDACFGCWPRRRLVEQCRHQSWKTISGNDNMMLSLTKENTLQQKTINLSSRTTYIKVGFTLFQEVNNIIKVKVNGHSPVQLEYIENETSRFRKNGILSASENYIRDNEGNLQHTKVVLHIDLSQKDYDKKFLKLQFEMIPTKSDDEEGEIEEDEDEETVINHLVIKGANACAVKWSKAYQEEQEQDGDEKSTLSETTNMTAFERKAEWILSDKLTAVLNAISDADMNHCLNGRDPVVHVNLYKRTGDGQGEIVC